MYIYTHIYLALEGVLSILDSLHQIYLGICSGKRQKTAACIHVHFDHVFKNSIALYACGMWMGMYSFGCMFDCMYACVCCCIWGFS